MTKVCFVTGTSRGLGAKIAKALLNDGHTVVATARSTTGLAERLGGSDRLRTLTLDITDANSVSRAVEDTIAQFGRIDVLVNNAGHAQLGFFEMTREAAVRAEFDVNLFGPMAVTRAVLPHMRERRSGLIVTIASSSGHTSSPGGSIYSSSKFALEGWIEGLKQEVEPLGIRSLIVEPGMLRTDFLDPSSAQFGDIPIADYAEAAAKFGAFIKDANHAQSNDPAVLAAHIVGLIGEETPPSRFIFGDDALEWIGGKVATLQDDLARSARIASQPVSQG